MNFHINQHLCPALFTSNLLVRVSSQTSCKRNFAYTTLLFYFQRSKTKWQKHIFCQCAKKIRRISRSVKAKLSLVINLMMESGFRPKYRLTKPLLVIPFLTKLLTRTNIFKIESNLINFSSSIFGKKRVYPPSCAWK